MGEPDHYLDVFNLLNSSQKRCKRYLNSSPDSCLEPDTPPTAIPYHTSSPSLTIQKPYEPTAKGFAVNIYVCRNSAIQHALSTAIYLSTEASTMCKFFYSECQRCSSEVPCRLYDGNVEYCQSHLKSYPWHANEPVPSCLVVEEPDKHRRFDYWDNGRRFRTKPPDRQQQFSNIGCNHHTFVPSRKRWATECPYHKRGGLKQRLEVGEGIRRFDAVRVGREWQNEKNEERRTKELGKGTATLKTESEETAKERDSDGCCVVQ